MVVKLSSCLSPSLTPSLSLSLVPRGGERECSRERRVARGGEGLLVLLRRFGVGRIGRRASYFARNLHWPNSGLSCAPSTSSSSRSEARIIASAARRRAPRAVTVLCRLIAATHRDHAFVDDVSIREAVVGSINRTSRRTRRGRAVGMV